MSSPQETSGDAVPEMLPDFGRHNMFACGRDTVFLSHLPMFMAPHDTQLILEVALDNGDASLQEVWAGEREIHPNERVYTMMPEKFALSSLYAAQPPERGSFRATFFRGHLERGGIPIPDLTDVNVHVTRVVYADHFDRTDRPDDLTYRLFGRDGEWFLAHVIRQPPDFDQIIFARLADPQPDDEDVQTGISVVFPGRANTAGTRLHNEPTATARGHVTGAHQFISLAFSEIHELYFEEGELATSRGAFEPTPLETEAGFGD